MKVTLLKFTPDPEATVALAARLCYSDLSPEALAEGLTPREIHRLVAMLRSLGHESPFEHVSFTFAISGVSRSLTHQLVRHRIASYSQKSQRYVSEETFDFVVPPSVKASQEACRAYEGVIEEIRRGYSRLMELGIDREDARYLLPNACHTAIIVTMNARTLFNFFKLRCCKRAQWEIRALAYEMLREVKRVAPSLFDGAGPQCVSEGTCPEGAMSCGRVSSKRGSS